MEREQRRTLFELLEAMTMAEKVETIAAARLVLEREALYCRACGRRLHMRHDAACPIGEMGDTVDRNDLVDVAEAVERRLIQLRSGQEIPTRHELTDIPVLKPIAAKVRAIRPDLWND